MFSKKDLKAAFDLFCFVTILGTVMMVSYWVGTKKQIHYCDKCGYEVMLDKITDKE